jgi:hypothetical protein
VPDLDAESERLKLQFVMAYDELCKQGKITEAEFQEIVNIIEHIGEYSISELREKLDPYRWLNRD